MRVFIVLFFTLVCPVSGANDDLFNYRETDGNDYGPEDWDEVTCDDVKQCTGWPDDWELGVDWELTTNHCEWCPEGSEDCSTSRQSPIDLERNRAIVGSSTFNKCIDIHWMKYEDSSCTWDDLVTKNAFRIERHALKVVQPLEYGEGGHEDIRLDCPGTGERIFGRIDFSKGFSDWWFLSHIDIKVPSEHSQEGKIYSAEVQLSHFYSLSQAESKSDNKMATLAIFLQAYDDQPPYPHLDRLICEWRKVEDRTREECGLPSVDHYPGCFNVARGFTPYPSESPQYPSSAPSFPSMDPTTGIPTEPSIPPVGIPGAPIPAPTFAPTGTSAPITPLPTDVPSLAPTSKTPPTPYPTVPTTPDPALAITLAPIANPALFINGVTPAPTIAAVTDEPATSVTDAPTIAAVTDEPATSVTDAPVTSSVPAPDTDAPVTSSVPAPDTDAPSAPVQSITDSPTSVPSSVSDATVTPIAPISPVTPPVADVTEGPETAKPTADTKAPSNAARNLRKSVKDLIDDNYKSPREKQQRLKLEDANFRPADRSEEEWAEWIEAYRAHDKGTASDEQRKLLENDQLSFHNYQFMIDVRTEYYYRYSGTSTVPPCYGRFDGTRANTNHWRILKDPIRIAPRQLAELERLLRERIAPADANTRACKSDTAGKVDSDGHISVARPLQQFGERHYMVFCECENWQSKWPEDRAWCALDSGTQTSRFYDQPYNFVTDGF